jgi:pimeloyl-ACP methyl ester carboxylesterase
MRRRWKILIGAVVVIVVLLTLNTIATDNETKQAKADPGGRLLSLPGGTLQVYEGGDPKDPPMVLLHCFSCSSNWWDRMAPILARNYHVIRIDLLGHGGSEKPSGGYAMPEQARLVALALGKLNVEGAVVVGHSLGATVATALAEHHSELVDRVVDIDQAPDESYADFGLLAKLAFTPVIGELLKRTATDGVIKDGLGDAFAPGYDVPDQFVDDFREMTYTSFDSTSDEEDKYTDAQPLDRRLAKAAVPLQVIFGTEDQIYDADRASSAFEDVPGVRIAKVPGAGHSPNWERPRQTAAIVREFALDAWDEAKDPVGERRRRPERRKDRTRDRRGR